MYYEFGLLPTRLHWQKCNGYNKGIPLTEISERNLYLMNMFHALHHIRINIKITQLRLHADAFCMGRVQEIPVDFQGHSITPSDYHGVKQLIQSVSLF